MERESSRLGSDRLLLLKLQYLILRQWVGVLDQSDTAMSLSANCEQVSKRELNCYASIVHDQAPSERCGRHDPCYFHVAESQTLEQDAARVTACRDRHSSGCILNNNQGVEPGVARL